MGVRFGRLHNKIQIGCNIDRLLQLVNAWFRVNAAEAVAYFGQRFG
jgi:hypothetical protein